MLVASVIAVAKSDLSDNGRFGLLALVHFLLFAYAERERTRRPATATVLAHLSVAMTATTAIAGSSVAGATWPLAILVGGVVAAIASEIQSRRWKAPFLLAANGGALMLACAGAAAISDEAVGAAVPVGAFLAACALAAVLFRRWGRAIGLAVSAACVPILTTLHDSDIGPGTLERLGAAGRPLQWSLFVGLGAALALAFAAHAKKSALLAVLGALSVFLNGLVSIVVSDVNDLLVAPFLAAAFVVIEVAVLTMRRQVGDNTSSRRTRTVTVIDTMMVLVEFVVLSGVFIASALMIASSRSEPLNAEPEAIASAVLVSAGLAVAFFDRRRCIALPLAVTAGTAGLMLALTAVAFTASAPIAVAVLALLALCGPLLADLRLRMTDFGRGTSSPWIPGMPTAASSVAITTALSAVAMLLTAALETTLRETIGLTLFAVAATCASLASALFAQRAIQSVDARVLAGALTSSLALGTLVTLRAQSVLDAPLDWLELRGVLASDVLALAFAIALAAAGWIATRRAKEALPSWLTDAPAIGWSGTYLVLNMVDRGPRPSLVFVALAIGVASAAFGGICRRIAPLTLGTALIVTTTLLGLGPTLAVVPVWLWIAFGGLSLIGLGLAIERKVGDEPWSPKTLVADVLDGFK